MVTYRNGYINASKQNLLLTQIKFSTECRLLTCYLSWQSNSILLVYSDDVGTRWVIEIFWLLGPVIVKKPTVIGLFRIIGMTRGWGQLLCWGQAEEAGIPEAGKHATRGERRLCSHRECGWGEDWFNPTAERCKENNLGISCRIPPRLPTKVPLCTWLTNYWGHRPADGSLSLHHTLLWGTSWTLCLLNDIYCVLNPMSL